MYRILIAIILMLPTFSHAINYLGFGGGNYVYAEQGNLYFNLNDDVFNNRKWTYDETKGFSAEIKVNMDLKTKYTSDDWLEQVIAGKKKSDGIMYANYIKQPFNYQNKGQYQQTWFWLARMAPSVGGFIGRTAAWNKFLAWASASTFLYGTGKYFCTEVMKDGITCGANGVFTKTVVVAYESTNTGNKIQVSQQEGDIYKKGGLDVAVGAFPATTFTTHPTQGVTTYNIAKCTTSGSSVQPSVTCRYEFVNKSGVTLTVNLQYIFQPISTPVTIERMVNDPELMPYFDKTCKLFSSECVNEASDGKPKDVVLTGGVVGSPVNVIGPPYTNPLTGDAQQDHVIIGGQSSGIGINSATNDSWSYSPTLGQSAVLNGVQVNSIARPDLTNSDTVPVAKPNVQTGTKPQVVVPPVTVPEFKDLNDMIDFCKANPNATSCVETGTGEEAESIFDKIKIPEINLPTEFSKDNFLPATAACPAPTSIVTSHGTIMYSYNKHCEIAAFLRPIILIMATITGLFIIIRSKD